MPSEQVLIEEDTVMKDRRTNALVLILAMAFLGVPWILKAQGVQDREIEIHKNVRLILSPVQAEMPADLREKYERFLPMLEEALAATTSPESPECALTIRVAAGFKEIGNAKVKRAFTRFTTYRRNSDQEFVAQLYLHSFITDAPVSKREITDFLKERILSLTTCQPKVTQGQASPRS
jgi:hypothetical protein